MSHSSYVYKLLICIAAGRIRFMVRTSHLLQKVPWRRGLPTAKPRCWHLLRTRAYTDHCGTHVGELRALWETPISSQSQVLHKYFIQALSRAEDELLMLKGISVSDSVPEPCCRRGHFCSIPSLECSGSSWVSVVAIPSNCKIPIHQLVTQKQCHKSRQ